jgi:hypothetical protein
MRPGCLAPRCRGADIPGLGLICGARSSSPAARWMKPPQGRSPLPEPVLSAARARCREALRAPFVQPQRAIAHARIARTAPLRWSPFWSPFFWRELTFGGSPWRVSRGLRKRRANGALCRGLAYGSDGTRTRDLRRDRPGPHGQVRPPQATESRPMQELSPATRGGKRPRAACTDQAAGRNRDASAGGLPAGARGSRRTA